MQSKRVGKRLTPSERRALLCSMEAGLREHHGRPISDHLRDHFAAEDAQTHPVAPVDSRINNILNQPNMYATNLSGVESALWVLLSLRGELLHGSEEADDHVPRKAYNQLKKTVGVTGNGVMCTFFGAGPPSEHPAAMKVYREWADCVRREQDGESAWKTALRAMLEELSMEMNKRAGAHTGVDAVDSVAHWLRTHPDADLGSLQHALHEMAQRCNLHGHRSACEVLAKLLAASFGWASEPTDDWNPKSFPALANQPR